MMTLTRLHLPALLAVGLALASCTSNSSGKLEGPASDPRTQETPITKLERDALVSQIEANWDTEPFRNAKNAGGIEIIMNLTLLPDGTVTGVKILNDQSSRAIFQKVAASALQAVQRSSPLRLPPGRSWSVVRLTLSFDRAMLN